MLPTLISILALHSWNMFMKIYQLVLYAFIVWFTISCKAQQNHLPTGSNHLAGETSPYLQQHANNPVDWYPWGDEALDKAIDEEKLMIISIGYSACHWCHVMEHESFEDSAVADVMNTHFVNIKVDREERPDVDDVYMTACQMSTGEACGWPLNAIALPNGKPVWAGTYFPKKRWIQILDYFIEAKEKEYDKLTAYANQLQEGMATAELIDEGIGIEEAFLTATDLQQINKDFINRIDWKEGGTIGAPKFPIPNNYLTLLQLYDLTGDEKIKEAVTLTLGKMAAGGIYDQLGGGFARYSVDAVWKVPHFEKMLYDNAQLISVYSNAYQLTEDPSYRHIVYETIDFIQRELYNTENYSFYSSLDADSEGEEGKFYVWSYDEVTELIADARDQEAILEYFDIRTNGNWEHGKNILLRKNSISELAKKKGLTVDELKGRIERGKKILFEARERRVRPGLDDKVLTSWNALLIRGLLDAWQTFGDEKFLELAINNINFLEEQMVRSDGRVWRTYKDGKAHINGFLDDYAHLIQALIKLYESTFSYEYLARADRLTKYCLNHFYDEESGLFYYTSDLDPPLIVRKKEITDNVIPSSNSTMVRNLYYLHLYLGSDEYKSMVDRAVGAIREQAVGTNQPNFYSNWIIALSQVSKPPYEVAIVGDNFEAIRKDIAKHFLPNVKFLGGADEGALALLKDKKVDGQTMIYVCQNKVCKFPVTEVSEALKLMQD